MPENKKLNILITKPEKECKNLSELIDKANLIFFPTIEIKETRIDVAEIDSSYNYLLLTSRNAVKCFGKYYEKIVNDKLKVISVGPGTKAECEKYGIKTEIIPDEYSSEGLYKLFKGLEPKGLVLFPCSSLVKREKYSFVEKMGFDLNLIYAYEVVTRRDVTKDETASLIKNKPDICIFTSPSSFTGYVEILKIENETSYFDGIKVIAMGKATKKRIERELEKEILLPKEFSLNGIKNCLIEIIKNGE